MKLELTGMVTVHSSQEMILFLDELKESSNYYILKNIECQKKSNQNKGAAILNE